MKKRAAAKGKKKLEYRSPKLKAYGDVRTLTKGKGAGKNDGPGVPKTKSSGPP